MAVAAPKMTTDTQEAKNVKPYWVRRQLERAKPKLVHNQFGNDEGVPVGRDNDGVTGYALEWLRPERIAINTAIGTAAQQTDALYTATTLVNHDANLGGYKLTQGSDPTSSDANPVDRNITITSVTANVDQFGAYYIGSDRLKRSGFHSFKEMVVDILGQNAGEVLDIVTRNQLVGNLTLQYAGSATSVNTVAPGHLLSFAELVEAVKTLMVNSATEAKNGHYVAIISPGTWGTLMLDPKFQESVIYGGKNTMFDGMINKGKIPFVGVEFWQTEFGLTHPTAGALTTVHSTFIIGKDAYGVIKLDDMGLEPIFHDVGSAGTNDPLNLRWTQAWKASSVAKVLNSTWGIELRHAVAV